MIQFFGSAASLAANVVLAVEVMMGLALIGGTVLARRKRFKAHAWCQSSVVLLNLLVIASFMVPSFYRGVEPGIPSHLGRPYYLRRRFMEALVSPLNFLVSMFCW